MKIAMIGHKHFMTREGGVERVVSVLAPEIKKMGNDVTVYDRYEIDKPYEKIKEKSGVAVKYAPTLSYGFLNAFLYSLSATILSLFQHFDVIHYHAIGPSAMIWIQKLFGRKVVVTVHGLDWKRSKWSGFASRYLKFGERIAVRYADEIIVLSESDKNYFMDKYNRKTVLIRNGVEKPVFKEPDMIKNMNIKKGNYFLYLGRIVPEKNVDMLIHSFKNIKEKGYQGLQLVIAGEISESNQYQANIKKMANQNKDIILTGFVDKDMTYELYSNCKAFVLPSNIEGMSIALLEALSYGIPCIASDIDENLAIGGDFIFSFPSGDMNSLSARMEYVIPITGYDTMQMQYIQSEFNWDEVVSQTISEYEKVINHGK